jgi:P27 family predicted phage terminase small subunit
MGAPPGEEPGGRGAPRCVAAKITEEQRMGRLPDAPGVQEAKGNPGRRLSAVRRREVEAQRVAELLAQPPADGDQLAPPAIIAAGPLASAAIAVWRDLAPKLAATHRLQPQHRPVFAMFCVYFAEWVLANEEVGKRGHTQKVRTVAGGYMERMRPAVVVRDRAFQMVTQLSTRFGLTPSDEYALFKDQAVAAAQNPGLFDRGEKPQGRPAEEGEEPPLPRPRAGLIGSMRTLDSEPPAGNC